MTKETSAGQGYHAILPDAHQYTSQDVHRLILTDAHHYTRQNVVDEPNVPGQVLQPPSPLPTCLSLPILQTSVGRSHLTPPENSPIDP